MTVVIEGSIMDTTTAQRWETTTITADDAEVLRARWYIPVQDPRGVVVIVPAMATTAAFYSDFASWLRDRGFAVLTFDYRGYGDSLRGSLRSVDADVVRWAHDARDVLAHAHAQSDGLPLTWVGHSLGGQIMPFADHTLIDRAVRVASGLGYWRLIPSPARRFAPLVCRVVAPVSIAVTGYYPGRRLGLLGDLPPGVMRQWSRWCMDPDYLLGELPHMRQRFADVTAPTMSLSFTDDELMSAASVSALDRLYTQVDVVRAQYSPEQLDVPRVGHIGFFRHRQVDLWDELVLPYLAV